MGEIVTQQFVFFIRLLLACVCGGMIGYERTNRGKGAGIRTHIIVALASALMMLVSKYGFGDMLSGGGDGSRIAAQVVSGVGFLGAGMIYFNGRHSVKGLTTAAGIWATSGVGLALGAGLYLMGILTSIMIVAMQMLLHRNVKMLQLPNEEILKATITDEKESLEYLHSVLDNYEIVITKFSYTRTDDYEVEVEMHVNVPPTTDYNKLIETFQESKCFRAVSI